MARLGALAALGALLGLGACTQPTTLAPGCRSWQGSTTSTEPPTHCFFFPGSMVMDPLGDVLYVTNTNADRSFGGSTLVAVDVLRHERAVSCFRRYGADKIDTELGDADCGKVSCGRSGAALGPLASIEEAARTEADAGGDPSSYDRCYCERDLLDPNVVNCEPQRFILSAQTTKLGFYPAEMQLLAEDPPNWGAAIAGQGPQATDTLHRGLYIAVRNDPSVTFVEARRPIRAGRTGDTSPQLTLDCGARTSDEPADALRFCAPERRVQRTLDDVFIDPNRPEDGTKPRFEVPQDPMGVVIDRGCKQAGDTHVRGTFFPRGPQNPPPGAMPCYQQDANGMKVEVACPPCSHVDANGLTVAGESYQYLAATHIPTAAISAFDLGPSPVAPSIPVLQDVSDPVIQSSDGRRGAYGLAPRRRGDLSQPWYVTSQLVGQISTFRLASAAGPKVVPGLLFQVSGEFSSMYQDVRDIVFESSGDRAYVALFSPPALAVIDTSVRAGSTVPLNQITKIVNLCPGPSRLALARTPRMSMGQWTLQTRVYSTCNRSGQLAEIDPESGEMTAAIQVGRGPQAIALNFSGDATQSTPTTPSASGEIDPCADPYFGDAAALKRGVSCPAGTGLHPRPTAMGAPLGPRAYISTYLDNAVAVVDLDPTSPSYRRLVSRIGLPSPKKVQ
ncbi:MAG: hypothetical protein U1A78_24770 [Polyangia bacterium]